MSTVQFRNRVFGCVILKSINSNFNADFTHHPRTLPDGVVYSTDKALKYAVKDYFRKHLNNDRLFYVKRYNENLNPFDLVETFETLFPSTNIREADKITILTDLLSCQDIRLFGATFAPKGRDIEKKSISIHGPVQINHGVNRFPENDIYTEDILSPFRNPGEDDSAEKGMSTIGNQTNLKEGHYVFHFSINPKNTEAFYDMVNNGRKDSEKLFLSTDDIQKLKEAFNNAVTALDSSRKIGTENEATVFVQLAEGSKKMLPSFTELVSVKRNSQKVAIDCTLANQNIQKIDGEVASVEVFYNPTNTTIVGLDKGGKVKHFNILNNQEL